MDIVLKQLDRNIKIQILQFNKQAIDNSGKEISLRKLT